MSATRAVGGASSLSSSSHFPTIVYSTAVNPVAWAPGCANLGTRPPPTGSATLANTIGIVPVSRSRVSRRAAFSRCPHWRPRYADISRDYLSQSLYSDARRAEEAANGAPAYSAANASSQGRHYEERIGTDCRYRLHS